MSSASSNSSNSSSDSESINSNSTNENDEICENCKLKSAISRCKDVSSNCPGICIESDNQYVFSKNLPKCSFCKAQHFIKYSDNNLQILNIIDKKTTLFLSVTKIAVILTLKIDI